MTYKNLKLRLLEYFDCNEGQSNNSPVKNKSNFVPPKTNDNYLTSFLDSLQTVHEIENIRNSESNMFKAEQKALKNLQINYTIIIKEADKGGATLIMDKTNYKNIITEMLSDDEYYIELQRNEDNNIIKKIGKLVKESEQYLTQNEREYLAHFSRKTSNF